MQEPYQNVEQTSQTKKYQSIIVDATSKPVPKPSLQVAVNVEIELESHSSVWIGTCCPY
jgi:hypothetical protein